MSTFNLALICSNQKCSANMPPSAESNPQQVRQASSRRIVRRKRRERAAFVAGSESSLALRQAGPASSLRQPTALGLQSGFGSYSTTNAPKPESHHKQQSR